MNYSSRLSTFNEKEFLKFLCKIYFIGMIFLIFIGSCFVLFAKWSLLFGRDK